MNEDLFTDGLILICYFATVGISTALFHSGLPFLPWWLCYIISVAIFAFVYWLVEKEEKKK